jgi:hypothetical protein
MVGRILRRPHAQRTVEYSLDQASFSTRDPFAWGLGCKSTTVASKSHCNKKRELIKNKIKNAFQDRLSYQRSTDSGSLGAIMKVHRLHWLDYDAVSFPLLVIAMGMLELLILGF